MAIGILFGIYSLARAIMRRNREHSEKSWFFLAKQLVILSLFLTLRDSSTTLPHWVYFYVQTVPRKLHEETRKIMKQILLHNTSNNKSVDWKWWSSIYSKYGHQINWTNVYIINLDVSIVTFASDPSIVLSFTFFSHLSKPIIFFLLKYIINKSNLIILEIWY